MKIMRLKEPVEIIKGHLFVVFIVITILLRCQAFPSHSTEEFLSEIQQQKSNNLRNGKEKLKICFVDA
jgi:hypothetical protein